MKMIVACIALALAGCATQAPQPAWRADAQSALDGFTDAYLAGASAAASTEFARARAGAAGTGDAAAVGQIELVRCAAQTASLDVAECTGFAALASDATPAQRAYASYLAGRWQEVDVALLPEQHRAVIKGGAIAPIADPLSRLVAAGAALRAGQLAPEGIATAAETASTQGWRRPLLAWLGVAIQRAQALGNAAEVARLRRRVALAQP
ncbi:hypothetical protein [Massilia sp. S19_KUP03_FR1]|uniref:hypothetical protein n=1 Tax=Massilia sp. S19_KUP03_FR1 TaxID=3025503 RepID=UPI002FCD998C